MMIKVKDAVFVIGILSSVASNAYSFYKGEKRMEAIQREMEKLKDLQFKLKEELIVYKAESQAKIKIMSEKLSKNVELMSSKVENTQNAMESKLDSLSNMTTAVLHKKEPAVNVITGTSDNSTVLYYVFLGVVVLAVGFSAYYFIIQPMNSSIGKLADGYKSFFDWFPKGNNNGSGENNSINGNSLMKKSFDVNINENIPLSTKPLDIETLKLAEQFAKDNQGQTITFYDNTYKTIEYSDNLHNKVFSIDEDTLKEMDSFFDN